MDDLNIEYMDDVYGGCLEEVEEFIEKEVEELISFVIDSVD
jgi:hypothetical protein